MEHNSKIFLIFTAVFVLFFVFGVFFGSHLWLLNYTISFASSVLIMVGTYYGYKRGLKHDQISPYGSISDEDNEERMPGDKFGILIDEAKVETIEDVKELKKEMRKFSFSNLLLGSKIFFSLYRVFGYALFILATMYLIKHEMWNIGGFVLGIFATTVSLIASMYAVRHAH